MPIPKAEYGIVKNIDKNIKNGGKKYANRYNEKEIVI
jgi:hypothetical protein